MACSAICARFVLCSVPLYTVVYCYFVLVTTAKLYIGFCLQVLACPFICCYASCKCYTYTVWRFIWWVWCPTFTQMIGRSEKFAKIRLQTLVFTMLTLDPHCLKSQFFRQGLEGWLIFTPSIKGKKIRDALDTFLFELLKLWRPIVL